MSTCRATVSSPRIRETRPDRVPEKLVGALSFTVLYFAWILSLLSLYPEYVQRYCNVPDLLGIYVLGLLIDQLLRRHRRRDLERRLRILAGLSPPDQASFDDASIQYAAAVAAAQPGVLGADATGRFALGWLWARRA